MTNRFPTILAVIFLCAIAPSLNAQTYNIYFGDIHSQTWYSDGNADINGGSASINATAYPHPVARAITYARDVATNMDFLGVSDHNHNESLNMTLPFWHAGNQEADSVNQDGVFVGMRGQEWGVINNGGHVLVYGTDKLFGWDAGVYEVYVPKYYYGLLFDSVKKYDGYCYFAHPAQTDYKSQPSDPNGIFSSPYHAQWDSIIKGTAIKNGPAFSTNTTETDPGSSDYTSRWYDLLKLGYHAAPIMNQDNHNTNFGMSNQNRTGVLSATLTRAGIDEALRQRRVYATSDHNLQLRFESGTHVMGEIFSQGAGFSLRIKASDPDGSGLISQIQLMYGVPGSGSNPVQLTAVSSVDSMIYVPSQASGTTYYYYAHVTETNGRQAWSAPMWITVPTGPIPQAFTLSLPSNSSGNQTIGGTLRWQPSTNATQYDVYLGTTNPPTTLVSGDQADTTYSYTGLLNNTQYWWKIVAKNVNGTTVASGAPWTFTTIVAAPASFGQTSPANSAINQSITGALSWQASANAAQYDVYLDTNAIPITLVSSGQSGTTYNYSGLLNSKDYYWKVVASNVAGSLDAAGAPWTFKTVGPSPGTFALDAPPNSAVSQPLAGLLIWNSSVYAFSYDVFLDTINPPVVRIDSNRIDTSYAYAGLLPGHSYHWKIVAKNENGTTIASDAPHAFTTINVPDAATNAIASYVTVASMRLTWTDNAGDETGYRLYRSTSAFGPFVPIGGDLPAGTIQFDDSNLALNTEYFYRIVPFNGIGEGNYLTKNASTLAVVAGVPVMSGVAYTSATLTINPSTNPPETEFAIQATEDSSAAGYVQSNGKLGPVPAWRNYASWGGAAGSQVSGLHSCRTYSFNVLTRNHDNIQTSPSVDASGTLPCYSISQNTLNGWNLFSMPVRVPNPAKSAVFPGSASSAFYYQGTYQKKDTLQPGAGFWLKYNGAVAVELSGEPVTVDSISVGSGWNLIGALSQPVSASSIVSEPPSIVVSSYFGYNGAYFAAESLMTMRGYWVKASTSGTLVLSASAQMPATTQKAADHTGVNASIVATFVDDKGHTQTLSLAPPTHVNNRFESAELPPSPPAGAFDVRFEGHGSIMQVEESLPGTVRRLPLVISSDGSPVIASLKRVGMENICVGIEVDGVLESLPETGTVTLNQPEEKVILVLTTGASDRKPATTALLQNYPNPFNPTTKIRFGLSEDSRVTLKVYDMLGREVATLLNNEIIAQGERETDFDAGRLASGVYIYRFVARSVGNAGSGIGEKSWTFSRQMVVLK